MDLNRQRWSIENAFSYLKSKGFDLEVTHLNGPDRVQLLLAVLALALPWCLHVGLERHQRKSITTKKHGRKAISLTRLGFDTLQEALLNMQLQWRDFRRYCRLLLSCT